MAMEDGVTLLVRLLLPLFVVWAVATALVAVAAVKIADRTDDGGAGLEPEAWFAIAASGAAVGGFLGISALGWSTAARGAVLLWPITLATIGMLLGAALAAGVVLAYLRFRDDAS
jgi:hypothetical protein